MVVSVKQNYTRHHMLTQLPKEILWLILKRYICGVIFAECANEIVLNKNGDGLHKHVFLKSRVSRHTRWRFDKTVSFGHHLVDTVYLVDCLYPLRLICKRTDSLLREKVTQVLHGIKVLT